MKGIKKIVILCSCLLLAFFLTACGNNVEKDHKTLVFRGESENWQAVYTTEYVEIWEEKDDKLHYDNEEQDEFVLKYKGTNLENVGQVKYEYTTAATTGGKTTSLDEEGTASDSSRGAGVALVRENDIITVTVEWNGNEETFVMHLDEN